MFSNYVLQNYEQKNFYQTITTTMSLHFPARASFFVEHAFRPSHSITCRQYYTHDYANRNFLNPYPKGEI
jgi:hypothetical protein